MPKVSRESFTDILDIGPMVDRHAEQDGFLFSFITYGIDVDFTELMKGLPENRCQSPHWGYVFQGRLGFRFLDYEEWFDAGDAFFVPGGHTLLTDALTDALVISLAEPMRETERIMLANLRKMHGA